MLTSVQNETPFSVFPCSFPACYAAEFGPIYQVQEGGVPLEHLLTCIPGIQVDVSKSGVKKIHWTENKAPTTVGK